MRTGEGTAFVAEQFGFKQILRNGRGVDGDERFRGSRAVTMQGACHQFLAAAGLAVDQDSRMRLRQPANGAEHLLHRRRGAKNFRRRFGHLFGGRLAHRLLDRAADEFDRIVDIKGLRQVLESTALERRHRRLQIRVSGHDDDRQAGMLGLDGRQQFEPGRSRHADIGHQHLRRIVRQGVDRLTCRSEHAASDALARERLFQNPADGLVVVDDPDRFHVFPVSGARPSGPDSRQHFSGQGQEYLETGVSGPAIAFNRAVVLLHEGLRQGQSKAAAAFPSRHQGIEDAVANRLGHARPVV